MLGKLNINSTLLISIGVALVLCAAVYYVNNTRMNRIESAINRQNQVLTAFIANVQNEIRGGALRQAQLSPDVSSEEARNSVAKQMLIQEQQIPRIVVSDNDAEESDSEAEAETDSDTSASEAEAEDDTDTEEVANVNEVEVELVNNNEVHHIKIVDIHNLGELPMFISEFKLETLDDLAHSSSITELASASETEAESSEAEASEAEASEAEDETDAEGTDAEETEVNNEVVSLDIIEEIKTIKLDIEPSEVASANAVEANEVEANEVVASTNEAVASAVEAVEDTSKLSSEEELQQLNYEHLKVDELRKIAVDLNKATKDEVKKLKKPELLYLLREPKVSSGAL